MRLNLLISDLYLQWFHLNNFVNALLFGKLALRLDDSDGNRRALWVSEAPLLDQDAGPSKRVRALGTLLFLVAIVMQVD